MAFVLGASEINPLRPHYYCPDCRKIQFADDTLCGWDLPAKKCSCGRDLIRDGHNLPFETLRPIISRAAQYDISVSQNLYQAAEEMISACFRENKLITLTRDNPDVRTYIILDTEFPGLSDGQKQELNAWGQLEEETGISEFGTDFAGAMIAESAPASISDLIQISGLCHGTGVWEGNGQALVKEGVPLGSLIAYRDDVFRCIQEKMKPEIGSGTGYAFRIMEDVRRGVYAQGGIPAETRQQLLELGIQERLIDSFAKISYLFPKAHGIPHVKHVMILMWYKIHHPEAFEKITTLS